MGIFCDMLQLEVCPASQWHGSPCAKRESLPSLGLNPSRAEHKHWHCISSLAGTGWGRSTAQSAPTGNPGEWNSSQLHHPSTKPAAQISVRAGVSREGLLLISLECQQHWIYASYKKSPSKSITAALVRVNAKILAILTVQKHLCALSPCLISHFDMFYASLRCKRSFILF